MQRCSQVPLKRIGISLGSCLAFVVAASCGGGDGGNPVEPTPTPAALTIVSGHGQTATVGQAVPLPLVVKVTQSSGAAAVGVSVAWAVTAGGGSLSAASSATDASGLASVTWTLGATAGTHTVTASVPSVSAIPHVVFSATATSAAPTPTKLAFVVQPSTVVAASVISPAVQVAIQDAQGNTVTSASNNVTVAITAGTGTTGAVLGGTATVAAVNGVATFSQLTIDRAGSGYTLSASATSLAGATSSAFTANPWYMRFVNNSFTPVQLTASGTPCANPIQPGSACTFSYATGRPASVSYTGSTSGKTSAGAQVGLLVTWNGTWTPSVDAADTMFLNVSADVFFLRIQNHSSYTMSPLYVNYGLVSQTLDNVSIAPSSTTTYDLGYYKAYTNTVVRAYRSGSSTLYWQWSQGPGGFILPFTVNQTITLTGI